jgi:Receptor family ligand binding region
LFQLFEYQLDGASSPDRGHRSAFNRVDFCTEGDDPTQCPRCLRLREARARDRTSPRSLSPSARPPAHHTISSPQHVYVAALFSVHEAPFPGAPMLGECGALEAASARQVEAFTWALKRVNEKILSPVNIKLGAVLLDACHSPGRALALPATLLGEGSEPILAAINALPAAEADAATSVFKTMNITTVMTEAVKKDENKFSLQMKPHPSVFVSALKETLKTMGWDYVSVVRSQGDESAELGTKMLRDAAVCVASEEILTSESNIIETVAKLIAARKNGARGVVLWTSMDDTTKLMEEIAMNEEAGKSSDLFWLVVNQISDDKVVTMVKEIMPTAIIFK